MKKVFLFSVLLAGFGFGGISLANATITYNTGSNISYRLNNHTEHFTGVGTITISDGTDTITILDRNLGATAAGTGCEGSGCVGGDPTYGYYFQWGNNYGFKGTGIIPITSEKVTWLPAYSNKGYLGSTFITSTGDDINNTPGDYWSDSVIHSGNHYDLWGGKYEDVINYDNSGIWKVTNGEERQGPCPDGFHVPSYGELSKIKSIMENDVNATHSQIWIPFAGGRQYNDASLSYPGYMNVLWSSSPISPTNQMSKILIMDDGSMFVMEEAFRANGIPIRCFYNEYTGYTEPEPIEITSISITGINLPVGGEDPTTGGIISLTEGITVVQGNGNQSLYRYADHLSWDTYYQDFVVGQEYTLTVPFTVADGYTIQDGATATFIGEESSYVDVYNKYIQFHFIATAPNNPNLTVTHYTDSDISYTINGDESFTGVGTITISDGTDTITILDRNLGATAAGTGCEDPDDLSLCTQGDPTYGYHFQRGNNYGFHINDDTVVTNATSTQIPASEVTVGYSNGTFITGDNWIINGDSKIDMRGGNINDGITKLNGDNWKVTNAEERQGPCPDGFHVPSHGELVKMRKMMGNDVLKIHKELLIPYAGGRDSTEIIPDYLGSDAYFWSSSPYSISSPESLAIVIDDDRSLFQGEGYRTIAVSLRCFYNEYEVYSKSSSSNQDESSTSNNGGRSGGGRTYTETLHETTEPEIGNMEDEGKTEFQQAYEFAYKNGITTMDTIEEADMEGPLTRIAMAKMLSQYAINILKKKPANVVVPEFKDMNSELDEEYDFGVTLAYQLGIMGINIDEFRPFDYLTRAELATALSRMLFLIPDGDPYYVTHIDKLKTEGIIKDDNPDLQELRGYVMIMLMRSVKGF